MSGRLMIGMGLAMVAAPFMLAAIIEDIVEFSRLSKIVLLSGVLLTLGAWYSSSFEEADDLLRDSGLLLGFMLIAVGVIGAAVWAICKRRRLVNLTWPVSLTGPAFTRNCCAYLRIRKKLRTEEPSSTHNRMISFLIYQDAICINAICCPHDITDNFITRASRIPRALIITYPRFITRHILNECAEKDLSIIPFTSLCDLDFLLYKPTQVPKKILNSENAFDAWKILNSEA